MSGYRRPFTLTDPAIAYPARSNIIPFSVVALVALLGPAVIIAAITFTSPLPGTPKLSTRPALRGRAWTVHAAWLGLCLSLAAALFVTEGLKTLVGKPRPDMLSTCHPDIANLQNFILGGVGTTLDSEAPVLVSWKICQQKDHSKLNDAFSSFPSGHSSFSWAGLLYLSLWLCSRLSIMWACRHCSHAKEGRRHEQAAPPLWQVLVTAVPIGVALFICGSRYADFHHAGIDIFAGAVIGIVSAVASFFLYHQPICNQGRMAFSPRPRDNAFMGNFPHGGRGVRPRAHDTEEQLGASAGTSVSLDDLRVER